MSIFRGKRSSVSPLGMVLATLTLFGCQFNTGGLAPRDGAVDVAVQTDADTDASTPPDGGGGCNNGDQRCYGPAVQLCVGGVWTEDSVCDWGCNSSVPNLPYCGNPLWAETVDPTSDVGTGNWSADTELTGLTIIDTDTGTITTPSGPLTADYVVRTHYRSGGLEAVTILGFNSIFIPLGARVEVVGSRALALVAYESIVIAGELMAQGRSDGTAGPGGYSGGVDGSSGSDAGGGEPGEHDGTTTAVRSGGGGGGHTGLGGDGATPNSGLAAPGLGGFTVTVDPINGPLVGGHGGGASPGTFGATNSAPGGGGGGAIMLAAQLSVEITPTGVVNVGGGGGSSHGAGAGGGSGGMLLIQTPICLNQGVLAANGGGGGDVDDGDPGAPGSSADTPTPGGGSHGGTGGAGSDLNGSAGSATGLKGGGGGGAAGFIRFDTVQPPDIAGGTVSPHEGTAGHAQNAFPTT